MLLIKKETFFVQTTTLTEIFKDITKKTTKISDGVRLDGTFLFITPRKIRARVRAIRAIRVRVNPNSP